MSEYEALLSIVMLLSIGGDGPGQDMLHHPPITISEIRHLDDTAVHWLPPSTCVSLMFAKRHLDGAILRNRAITDAKTHHHCISSARVTATALVNVAR